MTEQTGVVLRDQYGNPLKPLRNKKRALAGSGWGDPPYDAANIRDQRLAAWNPWLYSPDVEINIFRDRIVSRVRDLVRNDGWASGAVTRILDNTVGPNLRPVSKPDHRFLAAVTGNSAFDRTWAKEFGAVVDTFWRAWSDDPARWCDATRNQSFSQMMRVAFRHKLVDGDALAMLPMLWERVGAGRARYATAVQLIDPDRLSNPQNRFDDMSMRGGVRIDQHGAAIAYSIRRAHQSDWFMLGDSVAWDLIPRETSWGRPIIVHDFDGDRASQHRGGVGIFGSVVQRLKMLTKYDGVELDSAILNSLFCAYLVSPYDHALIQEAVDSGEHLDHYQELRNEFHDANRIMAGDARVPILFPGEEMKTVDAVRPASNFEAFENAALRNVASGLGISHQQLSNDWSSVNYSSARAALLESWKTFGRRKWEFGQHFCSPIRSAWMEELMDPVDGERLPLPAGAPDFILARAAYSRARWLGPGRGYVDPVAERQGSIMGMQAGLTTLEHELSDQGEDLEDIVEQRAYEIELFKEHGIPLPPWVDMNAQGQKDDDSPKPQKPQRPGSRQMAVIRGSVGT